MPDRYGDDFAESVRHGIRVVKLDLIPLLTAMGLATRHLGVGGTYSTTYYEPFHVARVFSTLDHMVGGRAAWNVVTSLNDSEAANFGRASHPEHDARYDRADEFMEAVLGHWDTWEDDAIVLDRERGVFADPAKVHRLDHAGKFFRTRGPVHRAAHAQGHPVHHPGRPERAGPPLRRALGRADLRDLARPRAAPDGLPRVQGRDGPGRARSGAVRITPAVYCVVGETRAMAEDKAAYIDAARPSARQPRAPVRGAQLRLRRAAAWTSRSRTRTWPRSAGCRPSATAWCARAASANPTVARLHPATAAAAPCARCRVFVGTPARGRRRARGVVHRRGLRRLRARRDAHAGRLRGLRAPRRAGAAAPRLVPPRVRGRDAAREPRARAPRSRRRGELGRDGVSAVRAPVRRKPFRGRRGPSRPHSIYLARMLRDPAAGSREVFVALQQSR